MRFCAMSLGLLLPLNRVCAFRERGTDTFCFVFLNILKNTGVEDHFLLKGQMPWFGKMDCLQGSM